jgi:Telomere capping, CST complex subunit
MLSPGSVTNYSTKTALLTLEHNYPPGTSLKALVDVSLILNSLKSFETRIGEWVNVLGYVERAKKQHASSSDGGHVKVQALVLWSSGPLNLQAYEESLDLKSLQQCPLKMDKDPD